MKYAYRAFDRAGKAVSDAIDAASEPEAQELLRKRGLYVTELSGSCALPAAHSGAHCRSGSRSIGGKGKRLRDMSVFIRQLSVLVATGTPMVDAIASIERQLPKGEWKTALDDIKKRIEEGSPFSLAVESHPRYFDGVARSLIAAGESGGQLDEMLKRLAALTRQQLKVRTSVLGSLAYPSILTFISMSVLCVMLFFVLPRFQTLFESLGAPLPPTTRVLVDISVALQNYWYIAITAAILLIVGVSLYLKTAAGRALTHRVIVSAPLIGKVARALITSRITRVLGVLLGGRVPMLEAIALTKQSSGNVLYEALLTRAEELVTKGENISFAFEGTNLVPRTVVEAIRSGEKSGQLHAVLIDLSDFLDEDNDIVLRSLSSVVEPIILMFLGVIIGFVAISMFLPLFDVATATRQGGG